MSDIAELIFDNNSTLFEVLDGLDVPTLASQVAGLDTRIVEVNDQLRQLGLIVDNNQISNNTSFVSVNTRIDNVDGVLNNLSTQVDEVKSDLARVEVDIQSFDGRIQQLTSIVSVEQVKVVELTTDVADIQSTLQTVQTDVTILKQQLNAYAATLARVDLETANNTSNIITLAADVSNLRGRFNSIPYSMSELYFSTAYVLPGAIFTVVNQSSTNYWTRGLILDDISGQSVRMGQVRSGELGGVRYAYILFSDNVTAAAGLSFQIQPGMVPIGGPITMRYGQSATNYTAAIVRITKQYLN